MSSNSGHFENKKTVTHICMHIIIRFSGCDLCCGKLINKMIRRHTIQPICLPDILYPLVANIFTKTHCITFVGDLTNLFVKLSYKLTDLMHMSKLLHYRPATANCTYHRHHPYLSHGPSMAFPGYFVRWKRLRQFIS